MSCMKSTLSWKVRHKEKPEVRNEPTHKHQSQHNERVTFGLFFRSSLIFFIMDIKNCKASLELTVIFILSIRGVRKGKITETKRNTVNFQACKWRREHSVFVTYHLTNARGSCSCTCQTLEGNGGKD